MDGHRFLPATRYRISHLTFQKNKQDYVLLLNMSRKKLFKISKSLANFLSSGSFLLEEFLRQGYSINTFCKLVDCQTIVEENFDDMSSCQKDENDRFYSLHIIPTTRCNFNCLYCAFEQNFSAKSEAVDADFESIKRGIDFFAKQCDPRDSCVTFYGGEPLLCQKLVFQCCDYIENEIGLSLRKYIVTNGSLVTQGLASELLQRGFIVSVSIDGLPEAHDEMRKFPDGRGTSNCAIRGFEILQEAGVPTSILCTVGAHNVPELEKHFEFLSRLQPKGIALDLPMGLSSKENPLEKNLTFETCLKQYIKCVNLSYRIGIIEQNYLEYVKAFLGAKTRLSSCSASQGCQIVLAPDGRVGPCQFFLGTGRYFCRLEGANKTTADLPWYRTWKRMGVMSMARCQTCSLKYICGGGCAYNREVRTGSILDPSPLQCSVSYAIIDLMIERMSKRQKLMDSEVAPKKGQK